MDIFFKNPDEIPLPPDKVRIREIKAEPLPGGKLIHVFLEVDPSQKAPNADFFISNNEGRVLTSASIIESMTRKMDLTMHLPCEVADKTLKLEARLYFAEIIDKAGRNQETKPVKRMVVDQTSIQFKIPDDQVD
ncbi:MAG: hypothetical protein ACK2U3_00090 [Anaerolineales bacterium]|jgi:hypothetical protein